jgi:hypothetical protein
MLPSHKTQPCPPELLPRICVVLLCSAGAAYVYVQLARGEGTELLACCLSLCVYCLCLLVFFSIPEQRFMRPNYEEFCDGSALTFFVLSVKQTCFLPN